MTAQRLAQGRIRQAPTRFHSPDQVAILARFDHQRQGEDKSGGAGSFRSVMIAKPQPVGLPAFLPLPYFGYAQHKKGRGFSRFFVELTPLVQLEKCMY